VFQPCFGNWSDQVRSPWGRRKPFILIGTVVLILSILSIAWADSITQLLTQSTTHETYRVGLVIVTLSFTISMFIAVQAVQVGLRALIADGCTPNEQVKANAWASGYSNLAAALSNLSAYTDGSYTQRFGHRVFKDMSLLAAFCLAITVIVSCLSAREQTRMTSTGSIPQTRNLRAIWRLFFRTSSQIRTVCLVQVFPWVGWFPFLFYTKTFVFFSFR
jgi:solute carrier family 45, member 1/2/4